MSTKPQRIQLSRRKGWRMPPNTVSVARPGPWGNPFSVTTKMRAGTPINGGRYFAVPTVEEAIECFREMVADQEWADRLDLAKRELRGKNLACWCPLTKPCHADVLLRIANCAEPWEPVRDVPTTR